MQFESQRRCKNIKASFVHRLWVPGKHESFREGTTAVATILRLYFGSLVQLLATLAVICVEVLKPPAATRNLMVRVGCDVPV
jgi:hypothetical protein